MRYDWLYQHLLALNLAPKIAEIASYVISICLITLIIVFATLVVRKILLNISLGWLKRNKYSWDGALLENNVINKMSWFIPILLLHLSVDSFLPTDSSTYIILKRIMLFLFVIVGVLTINALLSSFADIQRRMGRKQADVIQGFVDAGKITSYIAGGIFVISIFSGISPWGIISVLGGMTAITMLIFKDTIVGFVASIQLTTTNMVRMGDWIEMPAYGADGDIISISIHTVRVRNWDKTITTIPTYALVANSFKNWRGMTESGGRRIKRALMLDVTSIKFCSEEQLQKLKEIRLLADYLETKTQEIEEFNREHGYTDVGHSDMPINGRRQTNIGVFRAYVIAYLKNNPLINKEMTFMVRQLAPSPEGLPLEVYVFSSDKRWVHYEVIQSDIFDHLYAALPSFDLRPFQVPSGYDLQKLGQIQAEAQN